MISESLELLMIRKMQKMSSFLFYVFFLVVIKFHCLSFPDELIETVGILKRPKVIDVTAD